MSELPDAFRRRARRPAVVGHRGTRASFPENSLAAIREAARQGADAVEVDVRRAASGECYVLHDPDLARVAGDARPADSLTWSELRRVDLGGGERPPLLSEVIELCKSLGLGLNAELKHDAADRLALARAAAKELADAPVDLVVSSFDPWLLLAHKALANRRCHALLVHESTYHDWALRAGRGLPFDGLHLQSSIAVPARVSSMGQRRFVNVWTVNRPDEARRIAALGASAIISDHPARVIAALADADGPRESSVV
ncbi:MAG: glycerophosphodiester phosphodiesterase family protein [Polyangiaceae bacterium]